MTIKNVKEIRDLSAEDLKKELDEMGLTLFTIKSKANIEKSAVKSDIMKKIRKCRARMMTILAEKDRS